VAVETHPEDADMIRLSAIALLLLASTAHAADLTIDAKVQNGVAILTAQTEAKTVVWIPVVGLTPLVPAELLKDSKTLIVAGKGGPFRVVAIAAPSADKPVYAEATFTFSTPEPPAPYVPPVPPPPPVPADELPRKLKDAYAADSSPGKRGQLINLTAIYSTMAEHAEKDASITTSRTLLDVLTKVKSGMLADGILLDLRRIVSAEIASTLGPPSDAPLDRARAFAMFQRIVRALPSPE
jgi:hypothetical protein